MHGRAERLDVGLDQPLVAVDLVETFADRVPIGGPGLGNGQRRQLHAVIGIGHAHGGGDIVRALDGGIFSLELGHYLLAYRRELAEEAEGLDEVDVLRVRSRQFGEATTGRAPVRDHRHLPAHAVERLDHLGRGADVTHQIQGIGTGGLQAAQLRYHVHVAGLELLDAGGLQALLGERGDDALFIRFAPRVVDQNQAGLAAVEGLLRVVEHGLVHQLIDCRDAEGIVGIGAILGHSGAGRPGTDEGHFLLVDDGHDGHRDRRIEATEEHRHLVLEDQFTSGHHPLGRIALVIAAHQFQLAPTEQAALGIDLVDGDAHAARERLAGLGRLAGQRGDQTDLDGLGRHGQGGQRGGQGGGSDGDEGAAGKVDHGVASIRFR